MPTDVPIRSPTKLPTRAPTPVPSILVPTNITDSTSHPVSPPTSFSVSSSSEFPTFAPSEAARVCSSPGYVTFQVTSFFARAIVFCGAVFVVWWFTMGFQRQDLRLMGLILLFLAVIKVADFV